MISKIAKIPSDDGSVYSYEFHKLPVGISIRIFRQLMSVAPIAFGKLAEASLSDADGEGAGLLSAMPALAPIFDAIGDFGDDEFFRALLTNVSRSSVSGSGGFVNLGDADSFGAAFNGDLGGLLEAVVISLIFNFSSVIKRVRSESFLGRFKSLAS